MRFLLLILFSFFISSGNVFPKSGEDPLSEGLVLVYKIQFDSAKVKFDSYVKSNPKDPAGYFFLALIEWWKINIDRDNEQNDDIFLDKVKKTIEVADEILDKNENDFSANFYKGGALGYRGLLRSMRESWLKAAEDGKEALNLLQHSLDIKPDNKDVLFGIGVYNYFAEFIPDRYPLIKPLMVIFPKGDKIKGLYQIKETAKDSKYAKYEARYILSYLYLNFEKNFLELENYSKDLHSLFPENPVFEKYLYTSYVGQGRFNESLEGYKAILMKSDSNFTGYRNKTLVREANYYCAISLYRLGKLLEAGDYLKKSEELTEIVDKDEATAYGAFTYLMFGMYYDLKGEKSKSFYYYDKVIAMNNFESSKSEAENYKKNPFRY